MELKPNVEYKQVLNFIKQLHIKEWEKLKNEMDKELIRKKQKSNKKEREFGCMKGIVAFMANNFNDPIDDFKEYM